MGLRMTLAGVDVTAHVDEESIQIVDSLGQGAGAGGGGAGRASTASFLTDLGPMSKAVGAGTPVNTPTLVRQGEVVIYDANNVAIYGGFASKYSDVTDKKQVYTKVDCVDYWQHLDRVVVNEIYDGQTDIFMVRDLLTKYAPWLNLSMLPTASSFFFEVKNYRHFTLQAAINDICNVSGYQIWIDTTKHVHYENPVNAAQAPFGISDTPDNRVFYPGVITTNDLDDTAAINRVFFYGGKSPSGDFTQDISTQANGHNTLFTIAYYPRSASDGKIHLTINGGPDLVIGDALGTSAKNTLKSKGGLCDAVIDYSAQTVTFNTAPAAGATVWIKYRYQTPLVVVLTDQTSKAFFGGYLDGVIVDSTIFDKNQAVERCRILLLEQHNGLHTINASTWTPGLRAGTKLNLVNSVRQISETLMIQQVTYVPLGAGNFRYDLQLGSWSWNFIDVMIQAARATVAVDTTQEDITTQIDVEQFFPSASLQMTQTIKQHAGPFYARSAPANDGHDAYCGFFFISH